LNLKESLLLGNKLVFFILLFLTQVISGQTHDDIGIHGKIVVDTIAVEGVNITNSRSEKATISNKKGVFSIVVKVGDILVLSAVNLETRRKIISEEDLKSEMLIFNMSPKTNHLKEVIVRENTQVNAVSMGILQKEAKKYTPAERKLYTATTGGGIVPLNPIINWLSGRTTMLKKEVVVEKNEKLLLKLDGYYEDKYYTDVLKIPQEYIKGFQYYLIEDVDFVRALQEKNKTMTLFLVKGLARNYNEIIQHQQK
jgi:hypothetical protein